MPGKTKNWKPINTAPKNGLILLKWPAVSGGSYPVVAKYSAQHGAFTTPGINDMPETVVHGTAWTEIPAYDDA